MGKTKTFNEASWDYYLENQDVDRDVVAMSFLPVTASELSESDESQDRETPREAPSVVQPLAFDEFAGAEPRKRNPNKTAERREFLEEVIRHDAVIDEPSIWREETRDSRNVKAFKHVVANYLRYRLSSCVKVANLSDEGGKAQFKPNVQANRLDFYADVSICVRKSCSASLYAVWVSFFVQQNGEHAEQIPSHVFLEIAERAGKLFLANGLHPIHQYFKPTLVVRGKKVV